MEKDFDFRQIGKRMPYKTPEGFSIALLLVFSPLSHKEQTDSLSRVEQAFANLSQEDQAYMLAVYQEDLFMNE